MSDTHQGHQIEVTDTGYRCVVCLTHWTQEPSAPACRGYPIYRSWKDVPRDTLATESTLGKQGLKPGPHVRAKIAYGKGRRHRCYNLYAIAEALAKDPATPAQLAALEKAHLARRTCVACGTIVERIRDLNRRRCKACVRALAQQQRAAERDTTILWARDLLGRRDWVLLDTETTDLADYGGVLVEIAILSPDGTMIFASLVNPLTDIAPSAVAVHGITRDLLWDAPTFGELEPQLRALLHGKMAVAYNAPFDSRVLRNDVQRLCIPPDEVLNLLIEHKWVPWPSGDGGYWRVIRDHVYDLEQLAEDQAAWWTNRIEWQCAMEAYATFIGERYRDSYRWQPLPGAGHRAAGDCLALLSLIKEMAATPLSSETQAPNGACVNE